MSDYELARRIVRALSTINLAEWNTPALIADRGVMAARYRELKGDGRCGFIEASDQVRTEFVVGLLKEHEAALQAEIAVLKERLAPPCPMCCNSGISSLSVRADKPADVTYCGCEKGQVMRATMEKARGKDSSPSPS